MKINEIITEQRRPDLKQKLLAAARTAGGDLDQYFVRFTQNERFGYSAKQTFGRSPDVDSPDFDIDYIGAGQGRPALWFYPLKFYLKNPAAFATELPYVWLVKLKSDAWLQTVKSGTKTIEPAPEGKNRVGILRLSQTPAAIFFKPGFVLIGRFYDYAGQHQRHGEVKGPPKASWFDRVRGLDENFADGRRPQDKGDSRRHGIPKKATLAQLEKIRSSKTASPRKKQLAHWQINMRRGRNKKK